MRTPPVNEVVPADLAAPEDGPPCGGEPSSRNTKHDYHVAQPTWCLDCGRSIPGPSIHRGRIHNRSTDHARNIAAVRRTSATDTATCLTSVVGRSSGTTRTSFCK